MPGKPARLTIAGSFRGHPVRVDVGPLCNPPTPLIRAKATLFAAFEHER